MLACIGIDRRRPLLVLAAAFPLLLLRVSAAADVGPSSAATNRAESQASVKSTNERIQLLIRQLGSPQFAVRRSAAAELRSIGPEAFDQLRAATDDSDPEIAANANYLLRQIDVHWTRGEDSATVRQLMTRYGDREDKDRELIIKTLAGLPEHEGVGALCRIARFDPMPLLSRFSAMAVVQSEDDSEATPQHLPLDPAIFDRELGDSRREAVLWLRQYQVQLRDPAESVAGWQRLIDEESKQLDSNADQTSPIIVSAMLWNLADVQRRLGATEPLLATTDRLLALGGDDSDRLIERVLLWLTQHESWKALDQFASSHDERIQKSKRALYRVAVARAKQQQTELAEELAERAAKLAPNRPFDGLEAGFLLESLGKFEWAVREYRIGFDEEPIELNSAIGSRVLLSNLLQDYEQYAEAAAAIEPLVTAIDKNRDVGRAYESAQSELAQFEFYLPEAEALPARWHYLRACDFLQNRDVEHQREELLAAIEHDETDADVLIAMYRVEGADDAWMADTRKRIAKLSRSIEEQIEDNPNNWISYNQWAWLIANTEGDFTKAVRYSRRSLELKPGTASFLDTLGRCYYSAGEFEKAVESQREAVRLIPHMQVMQRQLKVFEKTLAEKAGSRPTEREDN